MIKKRSITAVAATAAAPLLALALAVPASASTGPRHFASCATNDGNACAGYIASSAQFRFLTNTAFLRNPAQYSAITNAIGWQDGLKSANWDVIIGISDTTTPSTIYSPSFVVYHNGVLAAANTNATWCPAGQSCTSDLSGAGFQPGDTVTESVFYNQAGGVASVTAIDPVGNAFQAFYPVGVGVSFGQARIEAGYGTFSPPAGATRLVRITGAGVTLYNGNKFSLAAWFVHSKELATSTGTEAGTLEASPTDLANGGTQFDVNFQP
jgi:hypothetical protein